LHGRGHGAEGTPRAAAHPPQGHPSPPHRQAKLPARLRAGFVGAQPKALLEWLNMAGDRSPLYVELDPRSLRKLHGSRNIYVYDGETRDPRFESLPHPGTALAP
jgi:hypothetical protein